MMFRKEGLKRMALSCILAFPLALGVASIGYCGGGAGQPPACQDLNGDDCPPDAQLQGPAMVGTLTLTPGSGAGLVDAVFEGRCQQTEFDGNDFDFLLHTSVTFASMVAEDLEGTDVSADVIDDTCNKPGTKFSINTVTSFDRPSEDVITANVVTLWWVCPTHDNTRPGDCE